jgi:hypothetical protein
MALQVQVAATLAPEALPAEPAPVLATAANLF